MYFCTAIQLKRSVASESQKFLSKDSIYRQNNCALFRAKISSKNHIGHSRLKMRMKEKGLFCWDYAFGWHFSYAFHVAPTQTRLLCQKRHKSPTATKKSVHPMLQPRRPVRFFFISPMQR
jgi:hypothetical protein